MRRFLTILAVLLLLVAGVGAGALWWFQERMAEPYRAFPGQETVVVVEPGTPAARILVQLEEAGVIADARLARLRLRFGRDGAPLQAGEYRFTGAATVDQVLGKLIRGDVMTHPVTILEGLTLEETADALAGAGQGRREAFLAAMADPAPIADLDPEADDLEGYLFPSTYRFTRGTGEVEIVATLVRTFRRSWRQVVAEHGEPDGGTAAELGSIRDVVTLASLVEREAGVDRERPVIAGVYANRLRRGIALYADPTVIYALKQLGDWDGNLRRPDLRIDHPYNTYVHPGLPPGPICSPGLASLRAATAPAEVPYLYFVSRNDGTHVFAETLAEHNRNVARWQKRYWREKWAEERRREAAGDGDSG